MKNIREQLDNILYEGLISSLRSAGDKFTGDKYPRPKTPDKKPTVKTPKRKWKSSNPIVNWLGPVLGTNGPTSNPVANMFGNSTNKIFGGSKPKVPKTTKPETKSKIGVQHAIGGAMVASALGLGAKALYDRYKKKKEKKRGY